MVFAILSFFVGHLAFSGPFFLLSVSLIFPAILKYANTAKTVFILAFFYYMGSSISLVFDVEMPTPFYVRIIMLITACSILSTPYLLLLIPGVISKVICFVVAILPPFGYLSMASPITATGLLFPKLGFAGILLMFFLIVGIYHKPALLILCIAILSFNYFMGRYDLKFINFGWTALSTNLSGLVTSDYDPKKDYLTQDSLFKKLSQTNDKKTLLPESTAGRWSTFAKKRWSEYTKKSGKTLLIGTEYVEDERLYNALAIITPDADPRICYVQRLPVPWMMWRLKKGFFDRGRGLGSFDLKDGVYGGLICYEALLPFYNMTIFIKKPAMVFVSSNVWWSTKPKYLRLIKSINKSWSYLFNTPYLRAYNT